MSNNKNTDRDKMLEDILSTVGGKDPLKENSRAARAAASSANRAASEKRLNASVQGGDLRKMPSKSAYARSGAKKNTSIGRTETMKRHNEPVLPPSTDKEHTDTLDSLDVLDRTENMSVAGEMTGNISRLIDAFDGTSSGSEYKSGRSHAMNPARERPQTVRTVRTAVPQHSGGGRRGSTVRRKHRKFSGRLPMVLILTTIIFTIAISLSVFIISIGRDMLAIGKSDEIKIVTIPEGINTEEVAQILYDENIIKMPKAFIFVSNMSDLDTKYIAGDHTLSPSYAYETIISELTTDKSLDRETVDITFVEGCNLISAGKQLEEAGVCEAERFVYYFNAGDYGYEFEKYLPTSTVSKFNRMEGYLFPDTYTFYVNTDPEEVCQKIYKNFNEKFKTEYYTKMKQLNMTLDEVVTLASIVQAESADIQTMRNISSVFHNRLANPEEFPKLQSDPTTYYVDDVIKPNIKIPSNAIFEAYDTYKCNGLPPGAIGNPGSDAIEAALYPAETNYYFFYANIDTNETFFAETDEEHEANIKMVKKQQSGDDNNEGDGDGDGED